MGSDLRNVSVREVEATYIEALRVYETSSSLLDVLEETAALPAQGIRTQRTVNRSPHEGFLQSPVVHDSLMTTIELWEAYRVYWYRPLNQDVVDAGSNPGTFG